MSRHLRLRPSRARARCGRAVAGRRSRAWRGGRGYDRQRSSQIRLELRLLLGCLPLGVQHLDTAVDVRPPLLQASMTLPELIELDESGLVGVEQSVFLAIHLGQLLLQDAVRSSAMPSFPGDAAWTCRRAHPSWIKVGFSEVWRDLASDECIQFVRPQIPLRATAVPPCPVDAGGRIGMSHRIVRPQTTHRVGVGGRPGGRQGPEVLVDRSGAVED